MSDVENPQGKDEPEIAPLLESEDPDGSVPDAAPDYLSSDFSHVWSKTTDLFRRRSVQVVVYIILALSIGVGLGRWSDTGDQQPDSVINVNTAQSEPLVSSDATEVMSDLQGGLVLKSEGCDTLSLETTSER